MADTDYDIVARVTQNVAVDRALAFGETGGLSRFRSFRGRTCCSLVATSGVIAIHLAWLDDGEEVVGAVVLVELSA